MQIPINYWHQIFYEQKIPVGQQPTQLLPLPAQQLTPDGRSVVEATRDPRVIRFALRAIEQRHLTAGLARHRRVLGSDPYDPWVYHPLGSCPIPFSAPYHLIWREALAPLPDDYLSQVEQRGIEILSLMFEELRARLHRREDILPLMHQLRSRTLPTLTPRLLPLRLALRRHRDLGLSPLQLRAADLGLSLRRGQLTPALAHPGPAFRLPMHVPAAIFVLPERARPQP